jgi:DNA-binding NarL/FixJ family response regulator
MRVVLADEHTLVRAGLRRLLEALREPLIEVIAECADGQAVLQAVSRLRPDLVILEHALEGINGQEVCQQLQRHYPEVKLMFLTSKSEPGPVRNAIQAGAVAYLVKTAEVVELELAMKALAKGQRYVSPKVAPGAFDRRNRNRDTGEGVLTPRQRQVLRMMARGKSTKEIAALMGVSVKTVETHRARMGQVLGLYGATALMRFAIKLDIEQGENS